jgi:hypothetical protein
MVAAPDRFVGRSDRIVECHAGVGSLRQPPSLGKERVEIGLLDAHAPRSDTNRWQFARSIMFLTVCGLSFSSWATSSTVKNSSGMCGAERAPGPGRCD